MLDNHSNECYNYNIGIRMDAKGEVDMNGTLNDLWHNYIMEKESKLTKEEGRILQRIIQTEEMIRELIEPDKYELLEKLQEEYNEIASLFSERAFKSGVEFSTMYLLDVIGHATDK